MNANRGHGRAPWADPYENMTPKQANRARAVDDLADAEQSLIDLDREIQLAQDRITSLQAARPAAVQLIADLKAKVQGTLT